MDENTDRILVSLGKVLAETRLAVGLSQEELAARCGLDRTYVSGVERGIRNPTVRSLVRLCRPLNIAPSEILSAAENFDGGAQ